jgi:hypothetical protein
MHSYATLGPHLIRQIRKPIRLASITLRSPQRYLRGYTTDHILAWSAFRMLCNQRARRSHYRRRLERLTRYGPP